MNTIRKAYTDGPFGQVHYRTAGRPTDKPALFCLHQSPKNSLEFLTFMGTACQDRLVVAGDYPGYGMSDRPPSEQEATIPAYAQHMWKVADALSLEKVDLFGNHTGGKVACEMAKQQLSRVRAIAMVSAAILTDEERAQFSDYFTPIPLDKEGTRIMTNWRRIVERADPNWPLEAIDRSLLQTQMGGEAYEWGHHAAFSWGPPFEEALAELPHRKIILNPADDLQVCTRRAETIMKNGEIIELPQWTYGFMDIHPRELRDLLLPKLDAA
ncbi:MAG: alpha/beta hydrolase [Parvularcula sp.]|jgi:pimeloyl-ACP methyl ester carboxylesterase|nr:alpha/beta hydrolase [Parvularcula sp.]